MRAIEWVPRVSIDERAEFERRAQEDGFADFHFTERNE
ncbi:MAG: CHASE domain-containing protein, partial [Ilumatobacteraceae bacterium]